MPPIRGIGGPIPPFDENSQPLTTSSCTNRYFRKRQETGGSPTPPRTTQIVVSSFPNKLRSPAALRPTYTVLAHLYDAVIPRISARARTLGLSWLDVQDGERVLDVGTGTGLALRRIADANPQGVTVGVDLTPTMLRLAQHRMSSPPHNRYRLRRARATALPPSDNALDAVFSSYLIDVLPTTRIRPALREMHRVLRPGGRLVLVALAPPHHPIEHLWGTLARLLPPLFGGARPVSLRPPLREVGFHIQAHTTCSQGGLRSAIIRASPS